MTIDITALTIETILIGTILIYVGAKIAQNLYNMVDTYLWYRKITKIEDRLEAQMNQPSALTYPEFIAKYHQKDERQLELDFS